MMDITSLISSSPGKKAKNTEQFECHTSDWVRMIKSRIEKFDMFSHLPFLPLERVEGWKCHFIRENGRIKAPASCSALETVRGRRHHSCRRSVGSHGLHERRAQVFLVEKVRCVEKCK
jgi:hypothetical protein